MLQACVALLFTQCFQEMRVHDHERVTIRSFCEYWLLLLCFLYPYMRKMHALLLHVTFNATLVSSNSNTRKLLFEVATGTSVLNLHWQYQAAGTQHLLGCTGWQWTALVSSSQAYAHKKRFALDSKQRARYLFAHIPPLMREVVSSIY